MTRHLIAAFVLAFSMSLQAATEVIPLKFRMAQEMLPVAESVVGAEGKVSAYGNQLIVNAPPAIISELRTVLDQLDQEPRRLLISIDSRNGTQEDRGGYRVDGTVSIGDADVRIGQGERGGRDQVRIDRRTTTTRGSGVQQVQATEGYPALIQIGQSVPLVTRGTDEYGRLYQQTHYRDVTRGFYATATVHGDQVQVTITSQQDRLSGGHSGSIDLQETATRVSGRLGEWLTLGSIDESGSSLQDGTLRRYSTRSLQDLSLRLKVELLD